MDFDKIYKEVAKKYNVSVEQAKSDMERIKNKTINDKNFSGIWDKYKDESGEISLEVFLLALQQIAKEGL